MLVKKNHFNFKLSNEHNDFLAAMSSGGQNSNNNQADVIPAGTVGIGPQSTLNPNGTSVHQN